MIQVINRAFDIIELLALHPETPKSLSEISTKLELNAGTCANILKTMVDRKYIEKSENQKGYCLGPMIYNVAGNEGYKKDLVRAAKDELETLTKGVNENTLLTVLKGEKRVAIVRVNSNHGVQATTSVEKTAFETTSGRLLIALLPDNELRKFIDKYGLPGADAWPEASFSEGFNKVVKKMREDQFAVQKTKGDMIGLAVPIYSGTIVVASLGVYMPLFRYKSQEREKMLAMMRKSALKISKLI